MTELDPSHFIVIIAVLIAAVRGWMEKRQAARQAQEPFDDLEEEIEQRRPPQRGYDADSGDFPPQPRPQPLGSLGDLYEEFRREILERQQRSTPPTPPPLPKAAPPPPKPAVAVAPALTSAEEAALQRLRQAPVAIAAPKPRRRVRNTRLFRSRSDVRRAFILKEVLDSPKALQQESPPSWNPRR